MHKIQIATRWRKITNAGQTFFSLKKMSSWKDDVNTDKNRQVRREKSNLWIIVHDRHFKFG